MKYTHLLLLFLPSSLVSAAEVTLTWTDNSTNEVGFIVERATGAGSTTFVEVVRTPANVNVHQETVAEGQTYTYRVRAYNSAGNSTPSNTATVNIPVTIPAAPSNVQITIK